MVREIVELGQLNQEDSSGLKTHDEILELIKEIESIEDKFKYLGVAPENHIGEESVNQELEQTEATGELTGKSHISASQTKSELKEITHPDKRKDKKHKIRFPIEIHWKKEIKWPKIGNFLKRIKVNPRGIKTPELTELQNQLGSSEVGLRPGNTTFTLRIDDQGRLIGYNIKKPKSEGGHRRILPFGKSTTEESSAKEAEEPGIKGKIKGLFSRIKPKQSGESGGSKVSSLLGKIKGVLPKR
jgi:hypothetical protein